MGEEPDIERIEERVGELERLAESLDGMPDEGLVEALERAVELLGEINAGIEAGIGATGEEERALEELLDGISFGPFDEALRELEERGEEEGA
ncbi:hypothetical protein [Rubrobacter xylanophilus]|uniref:hypothetical protein n=1 Tax=Rubrobacter xylanophilus TaxID=49319 RepID=UPI001C6418C8|nr:hypothetical protein [Rubrobacter xylanophilus]